MNLDRLQLEYERAVSDLSKAEKSMTATTTAMADALADQKAMQEIAAALQETAHRQVAAVVTRCLQAVFGPSLEFRIVFEQKRGKTEARLFVVRDGMLLDPLEEEGGGVVDVAAMALRLVAVVLSRPRRRRLLLLDEPMKHLSRDHRPAIIELLQALAEELDFQIVMTTHAPELAFGKVVRIG